MTDEEIFEAIGRGCCTEKKAIENGCAVCAPMYEAVAIVRKRFAELDAVREEIKIARDQLVERDALRRTVSELEGALCDAVDSGCGAPPIDDWRSWANNLVDALRARRDIPSLSFSSMRGQLAAARHAVSELTESRDAAWAELAGVAQILGYERATAEDFGEVDVVAVRALALTTVTGRREARISAAERLRDLKAIGEAINRCGLMAPEERFQMTPCEQTVAAVEQLRDERDEAKKKLATLANAVAENDRIFKLWLDNRASDAQLQAADDALVAARNES